MTVCPGKSGKEIFRFQECSGSIFLELFAYFLFQDKKQDEEIIENSFNQTVRKGMSDQAVKKTKSNKTLSEGLSRFWLLASTPSSN